MYIIYVSMNNNILFSMFVRYNMVIVLYYGGAQQNQEIVGTKKLALNLNKF